MKLSLSLLVFSFLLACAQPIKDKTIGIQLFNSFSSEESSAVKDSISKTYHCSVKILPIVEVPLEMVTKIKSFRFRADSLLNLLDRLQPDSIDIMVGLTSTDIAITKINKETGKIKKPISTYTDWAIFGLGRINGVSCVISNYRLKKGASHKKYLKRLTRICNHEIGHVLGLRHCPNSKCLMNDANETIKTIDKSTGNLCKACSKIIF
ncbi:MAG: hypothetical protein AB8B72_10555 [Crocinitomicaceae bacterium]